MPNVHGIEFNTNQAELVKDVVRELLKDGNCAVYAVESIKPDGELRMASTPPIPSPRRQQGVFLRIRPGVNEATVVRPIHAKSGEPITKLNKYSKPELIEVIRVWRQETITELQEEILSGNAKKNA
jgi:hypothetical protein